MFLSGFQDSVTMRFAELDLGRNQWRPYTFSLKSPGENIPDDEQKSTAFTVTSVSVEQNSTKQPIPYVIPPGVNRQLAAVSNGQTIQQNEQALALNVCTLKDGDARGVYKEVNVDMRQFGNLRMFIHAESQIGQAPLKDGDVRAFIRIGSDFISNYYEYQIPLHISANNATTDVGVWPVANNMNVALAALVAAKTTRDAAGLPHYVPYSMTDTAGNTIVVVGDPNVGEAKTLMLGILNPQKDAQHPADDGMGKCTEVWFNELRMTGLNEKTAYAATGKLNLQLADLGSAHVGGSMHTQGYGNIDQKVEQRTQDDAYTYDANTNLALGKLLPKSWGVQLPLFIGYSRAVSNPKYNPYDLDVNYKDQLAAAKGTAERDSLKQIAQDFTSISSINLTNVRVLGNTSGKPKKIKPWSVKNFDLSFSHNRQFKRNPLIQGDNLSTNKLGLGYSYSVRSKPFEPFKSLIKSRSKWFALIKDFNLTLLPSNISFRTDLNRVVDETQVRNVSDGPYEIPATFYKNFTWTRNYSLRWQLTNSLSFDYTAINNSRIDEPYGLINTAAKRDSLLTAISHFGRNTLFTQTGNVGYALPLAKLPLTDWITMRVSYGTTYSWTAASQLAESLGNTMTNTYTKSANGELNFTQLYNKNRWLRGVLQPKAQNSPRKAGNALNSPGGLNGGGLLKPGGNNNNGLQRESAPGSNSISSDAQGNNTSTAASGKSNSKNGKTPAATPGYLNLKGVIINTANLTDHQLDSVRQLIHADEIAKAKAARIQRKKERKLARRQRRNTTPEVNDVERIAGRLLTMVKRGTVAYSENGGTILPGYMDSTRFIGVNPSSGAGNLGFAFGYQPNSRYLDALGAAGKLSTDTALFNAQFQQTYAQNLNITAQIEPIPNDLRIDLSLTRTYSHSHSELFKDTGGTAIGASPVYNHLDPYETGSFNISYISIQTLFQGGGSTGPAYQQFLANRDIISSRLGANNPYTNGVKDPNDPTYAKGYNRYSQDVLIPAFIAAYRRPQR